MPWCWYNCSWRAFGFIGNNDGRVLLHVGKALLLQLYDFRIRHRYHGNEAMDVMRFEAPPTRRDPAHADVNGAANLALPLGPVRGFQDSETPSGRLSSVVPPRTSPFRAVLDRATW